MALTDPVWQQHADAFAEAARRALWRPDGQRALDFLRGRGLTDTVIAAARLGLNSKAYYERWSHQLEKAVWLPEGIVIPWLLGEKIYRINIRRPPGTADPKYLGPAGFAQALYGSDSLKPACIALLVEGEFDALAALSANPQVGQLLVPIATGGTGGAQDLAWRVRLARAERMLSAFDANPAGDSAADWWIDKLGPRAQRLRPTQHDVNDMVRVGEDLAAWIQTALVSA